MIHQLVHMGLHTLAHKNPIAAAGAVAGYAIAGTMGAALLPALAVGTAVAVGIGALTSDSNEEKSGS